MFTFKRSTQLIVFLITVACFGCIEEEDIIIKVDTPTSCFKTLTRERYSNLLKGSTVTFLDSTVFFKNCSDSAESINYQWDFGDGTGSDLKNPRHKFSKQGKYKVSLITSNKNLAFDTASVVVSVIIGQKNIKIGETINNAAIDVVEINSGFLLLGTTNVQTVYPYVYTTYLMWLDEKMDSKGIKNYPAGTRFNSIALGHGGNFIVTGTTSGKEQNNELIKLDAEGNVLWSKVLGPTNTFKTVLPTPDNGYILTGIRNITVNNNLQSRNVIVKTDAAGNVTWEKFMNQEVVMDKAFNLVVENDGYVVAGVKRKTAGFSYGDSLVIAKMGLNGNVTWKNTIEWLINTDTFGNTKIAKMKNGSYNVINDNTKGIYIFSPTGEFLDRKLLRHTTFYQATTQEGNLVILQHEWGNGFNARVAGLSPEGNSQWTSIPDGRQWLSNDSYKCCSSSWPITIHALRNGGSILLANRVDEMRTGFNFIYVPVLLQLDETGQPM